MNFDDLADLIINHLKKEIAISKRLSIFEEKRLAFEDWVKVEVCYILKLNGFCDILTEFVFNPKTKQKIDITTHTIAIELKNIPTQIVTDPSKPPPRRTISGKKKKILDDIHKLNSTDFEAKIIIFLVYPVINDNDFEVKLHLTYIKPKLKSLKSNTFKFTNNAKGIIYVGLLK